VRSDSGEADTRPIADVFLMLGAVPNTEWLHGAVMLDGQGFVCTGAAAGTTSRGAPRLLETSLAGVFAVGDVRADSIKRVASGVGEGSVVVSSVHQYLARGDSASDLLRTV
jgi:thioredoxin reductase (NADPH)